MLTLYLTYYKIQQLYIIYIYINCFLKIREVSVYYKLLSRALIKGQLINDCVCLGLLIESDMES